jgi:hypothetical protein
MDAYRCRWPYSSAIWMLVVVAVCSVELSTEATCGVFEEFGMLWPLVNL